MNAIPKKIDPSVPIESPKPNPSPEIKRPVDPSEPGIPEEEPTIIPEEWPKENPPQEVPPPVKEI